MLLSMDAADLYSPHPHPQPQSPLSPTVTLTRPSPNFPKLPKQKQKPSLLTTTLTYLQKSTSLSPLSQAHFPVRTPSGSGTKIPHTDPLPTHQTDLEGLLNHHAGELQRLADRCDFLNEWMDAVCLVLERLKRGVRFEIEGAFAVAVAGGEEAEEGQAGAERAEGEGVESGEKMVVTKEEMEAMTEEQYAEDCRISELTERVVMIKKWRKELERSVVWQRDEHLRVEIALGRKSHSSGSRKGKAARTSNGSQEEAVVELDGKELLGVVGAGGKWVGEEWKCCREKWSRGTGRLPTQTEWEEMFGHYEERRMEERKKFVK